jgi:hypothetical protein
MDATLKEASTPEMNVISPSDPLGNVGIARSPLGSSRR